MQPDNQKAVYGFAAWLSAGAFLVLFFIWTLGCMPENFYFPSVYWSVGGPAVLAVTLSFYFIRVPLIGLASTQCIDDFHTATDCRAKEVLPSGSCLPTVGDLTPYEVTRKLYCKANK